MTDIYGLGDLNDILGGSDDVEDVKLDIYDDIDPYYEDAKLAKSKRFSHNPRVLYDLDDKLIEINDEEGDDDAGDEEDDDNSDTKSDIKINKEYDEYIDPLEIPDIDIRLTVPSHYGHKNRVRPIVHDNIPSHNHQTNDDFDSEQDDISDEDILVPEDELIDSDPEERGFKMGSADNITSGSELLSMFEYIVGGVLGGASFADIQEHYVNGGMNEFSHIRRYGYNPDNIDHRIQYKNIGDAIDAAHRSSDHSSGEGNDRASHHKHHHHHHHKKEDPKDNNDTNNKIESNDNLQLDSLEGLDNPDYENDEPIETHDIPDNTDYMSPNDILDMVGSFNLYEEHNDPDGDVVIDY
jgi:hypothetical protein